MPRSKAAAGTAARSASPCLTGAGRSWLVPFWRGCGLLPRRLRGRRLTTRWTLNVYNWGEYISDGSDGSLDTVKAFEAWYEETYGEKVHVNYTTYASNEDMYAKLKSGAVSYDVIIPSDYMIARHGQRGYAPAPELRQHPQLPIHRRPASAASTTTRTTPTPSPIPTAWSA